MVSGADQSHRRVYPLHRVVLESCRDLAQLGRGELDGPFQIGDDEVIVGCDCVFDLRVRPLQRLAGLQPGMVFGKQNTVVVVEGEA